MDLANNSHKIVKDDLFPLLQLAIPLVLTGIVGASAAFFETLFLAHVDQQTLAAGALVSWLYATLAVILFGTLGSINILISHKYGANDHNSISHIVRDGLLLGILLTIPAFLLLWNMAPIFLIVGQSPVIVLLAKSYLHALAWGLLPNFIAIALFEFIIGLGHMRTIMILTLIFVPLNIFFSFMLIFGKFGMPALGIAGAGWGMTISYWITAIVLSIFVLTNKKYKNYFCNIFNTNKPYFLWELLKVGAPIGTMYCVEVAFFFALTLVIGSISSQLLAINQITLQYMGAFLTVIFSIAQAITVRMGHQLGAKEINSAKRTSYTGTIMSITFMGIIAIFYWVFPSIFISADLDIHSQDNSEIVHEITKLFAISALYQIVEATKISLFGALSALKDTRFTLLTSIIGFWCIALPLGYLLAIYFKLSSMGFWWGMIIGSGFSVYLLLRRVKLKICRYRLYET